MLTAAIAEGSDHVGNVFVGFWFPVYDVQDERAMNGALRETSKMICQKQSQITIQSGGKGLYEMTAEVSRFVGQAGISTGVLTVFCQHTSCSLLIQENADPDVQTDLQSFFARVAPEGMDWIIHRTEGPDDMPAHIRAALTQTSLGIPIAGGRMVLGTWQGIYLFEHRSRPHQRHIVLHVVGEG